jgi:hypothetical protein
MTAPKHTLEIHDGPEEDVHLITGVIVCGQHRTYCTAPVKVELAGMIRQAINATDKRERTTCPECIKRHDEAVDLAVQRRLARPTVPP